MQHGVLWTVLDVHESMLGWGEERERKKRRGENELFLTGEIMNDLELVPLDSTFA